MNHPKRDEWIPLLFGEPDAETKARLETHLNSCAQCAAEVNGWRRSVERLDAWKLPRAQPPARTRPRNIVGFAAAAAVVFGAFVAGRFSVPGVGTMMLRTELKAELASEIQRGFARVSRDSSNALANLESRLASISIRNNKQMAEEFVQVIDALRMQDRQATESLFEKLQQQYNIDFVLLRRDLETLASTTDEEIEQARAKLYELSSAQTVTH
jgi:hypothetical protein